MENKIASIEAEIIERDRKDDLINEKNYKEFVDLGLKPNLRGRHVVVDTGIYVGIENVVDLIIDQIKDEDRVITIQGLSGTGKSSTAKFLAKKLNGATFSLGEVFRYLTYRYNEGKVDLVKIIKGLDYRWVEKDINLFEGEKNISIILLKELRSEKIEQLVPMVASLCQKEVVEFMTHQISKLAQEGERRIVIEGRKFTLDFLPCDLEVELTADTEIRAIRRSKQEHN